MWGTFGSVEIALRALQAQRLALDVIAHNIANANTPGYSRQVARLETTPPYPWPGLTRGAGAGQLGTGVRVAEIDRLRDAFTDLQLRQQLALTGYHTVLADGYAQVEAVFNEPSDSSLNQQLGKFFNAWQELALSPQDTAIRVGLIEAARNLAGLFNRMAGQLKQLQQDLDFRLVNQVAELNELADRIARLNAQIGQIQGTGQRPNDLLDQRDALLEDLARIVRAAYVTAPDGQVTVYIGGRMLIHNDQAFRLTTAAGPGGFAEPVWAGDGTPVLLDDGSGELAATLRLRDTVIPGKLADLNSLAAALAGAVNAAHRAGYGLDGSTGLDFFVFTAGEEAASLAVAPAVSDPLKIAAALSPGSPGDGRNALNISQIQYQPQGGDLGTTTLGEFYQLLVGRLGLEARQAEDQKANQEVVKGYLESRRDSFSGVSLDEEAGRLVLYQRAFEAAARSLSVLDEVLDHLINRTGLVGR